MFLREKSVRKWLKTLKLAFTHCHLRADMKIIVFGSAGNLNDF